MLIVNREKFMNMSNLEIDQLMIDLSDSIIYIRESPDFDNDDPETLEEYEKLENLMNQYQDFHYEKFGWYHGPEHTHIL